MRAITETGRAGKLELEGGRCSGWNQDKTMETGTVLIYDRTRKKFPEMNATACDDVVILLKWQPSFRILLHVLSISGRVL